MSTYSDNCDPCLFAEMADAITSLFQTSFHPASGASLAWYAAPQRNAAHLRATECQRKAASFCATAPQRYAAGYRATASQRYAARLLDTAR